MSRLMTRVVSLDEARSLVRDGVTVDPVAGCWLWSGRRDRGGHGRALFATKGGDRSHGHVAAHRVAYEAFVGPIPDGAPVVRRCRVSHCCNPDHLYIGSTDHARPIRDRVLAKIKTDPEKGCWLWQGSRNPCGYGQIRHGGRMTGIHRVAFEVFIGPVPPGLHVLYRCDVPACVNPEHLFLGTHADNMRDMAEKGRHWSSNREAAR